MQFGLADYARGCPLSYFRIERTGNLEQNWTLFKGCFHLWGEANGEISVVGAEVNR